MKYYYLASIAYVIITPSLLAMDTSKLQSHQNNNLIDLIKSKIDAGTFNDNSHKAIPLIKQCIPNSHAILLQYASEKNCRNFITALCSYYISQAEPAKLLESLLSSHAITWDNGMTYTFLDLLTDDNENIKKCIACLNIFKKYKINLDCRDEDGELLLCQLSAGGSYIFASELLKAGCNTDLTNLKGGHTALHLANTSYMAELFLNEGNADVDARDSAQNTPLHVMIYNNKNPSLLIKKMAFYGANIDAQNKAGNTPLHVAVTARNSPAILTLLELGADYYIKNVKGKSAISVELNECYTKKEITSLKDIV